MSTPQTPPWPRLCFVFARNGWHEGAEAWGPRWDLPAMGQQLMQALAQQGHAVAELELPQLGPWASWPRQWQGVREALRAQPAGLYWSFDAGPLGAVLAAAARQRGARHLVQAAGLAELQRAPPAPWLDSRLTRWQLRGAHGVLVHSLAELAALRQHHGRNGWLVPPFLPPASRPLAQPGGDVIWAGPLRPDTRPELFLQLARSLPWLRFVMLVQPDGSAHAAFSRSIQQQAAALPQLRWAKLNPTEEAHEAFNRASLLVDTRTQDDFPPAFLHAWSRAVPSLAFVPARSTPGPSAVLLCEHAAHLQQRVVALYAEPARWLAASQACLEHHDTHHRLSTALPRYRQVLAALTGGAPLPARPTAATPPAPSNGHPQAESPGLRSQNPNGAQKPPESSARRRTGAAP
jgi:hypothetical protein